MTPLDPATLEKLLQAAREVRPRAYAPYSNYQVGAALLTTDGHIFAGCNVENASYGLAICAERSAIASAIAAGKRNFAAIAVLTGGTKTASPCGACRQFMVEFNPHMQVILASSEGGSKIYEAKDLLPEFFTLSE